MLAALAHQRAEVQIALGAGADADHGDPPADRERVDVLGEVRRADELEDHVERAMLGEALGGDQRPRRAPRPALAQSLVAHRRGDARAARPAELDGRGADAAGAPWTSRRSPGRSPACVKSASWAVVKTSGSPPASRPVELLGHGHQIALVDDRELGLPAAADDAHHAVAALKRVGARAEPGDLAGELQPGMSGGEPGGAG